MLERNNKLLDELERLQAGRFKGQIILHIVDGVCKIIDYPKKPRRKELYNGLQEKKKEIKKWDCGA